MADWDVRELDTADEPSMRRHWELTKAANADRPFDLVWGWETAWATYSGGRKDSDVHVLGAFDGTTMVGSGELQLPLHDNLHLAYSEVFVDPAVTRRGVGSAVLAEVERRVRDAGRDTVVVEVYAPAQGPSPNLEFARAHGYTPALEEGMKALDLAATEDRWDRISEEIAGHHAAYRLVAWRERVPEEVLEGYCRLQEAFNDEAPMGELEVEAEKWDGARVRAREERLARGGLTELAVLAVAADGEAVGLTELARSRHVPWRAMQSGTLVLPGHRGHRLGIALKLANLRSLRQAFPAVSHVFTGNAGNNAAMNAVNDLLGFEPVERCIEVQKRLRSDADGSAADG